MRKQPPQFPQTAVRQNPDIGRFLALLGQAIAPLAAAEPDGLRVLCAVSGGGDSIALLHGLHQLAGQYRLQLSVGHVNHGLRPQADEEAAFVQQTARQWGLPCRVVRIDLAGQPGSPEEAARRLRYQALVAIARQFGANYIVTGHHRDDQIESLLLHGLRGTPPHGMPVLRPLYPTPLRPAPPAALPFNRLLAERSKADRWQQLAALANAQAQAARAARYAPMRRFCRKKVFHPATGRLYTIQLFRPMLQATRQMAAAYCAANALPYATDASNADPRYLRNRLRLQVTPLLADLAPGAAQALAQAAELAQSQQQDEAAMAHQFLTQHACWFADGLRVYLPALRQCRPSLQRAIVRTALRRCGVMSPSLDLTRNVLQYIEGGPGRLLPAQATVVAEPQCLVFGALPPPALPPAALQPGCVRVGQARVQCLPCQGRPAVVNCPPQAALLSREVCGGAVFRFAQPGDRFWPLGSGCSRSLADRLCDRGLSRLQRQRVVVLAVENQVLWVPMWTIAHQARLLDTTQTYWQLLWQE